MNNEVNLFQIEIPKRSPNCMEKGEPLNPGADYFSILLPDPEKGFLRHDFCPSCWEEVAKEKYLSVAKTAWKAKVPLKDESDNLSNKTRDEKAIHLLKEAIQKDQSSVNADDWAETFVLALYLARRRILYLRQELPQEDKSILCIYEVAATEEMLPVKRKSLLNVNIEELQTKIAHKLKK